MSRAKKMASEQGAAGQVLVAVAGRPAPMVRNGALMPRQKRVSLPNTPQKALAEAARVYAEARRGQLPVEDAARLSYALKNCADVHRDHVLSAKVDALKAQVEQLVKIVSEQHR
jgi:hypothetical protein